MERNRYLSLVWPLLGLVSAGHLCLAREYEAVVRVENASRVIVRTAPEIHPDTVATVVDRGAEFPLLGEEGDWFRIRLPGDRIGWIHRTLATRFEWTSVVGANLTLLQEPYDDAFPVGTVDEGERILVLRRIPDWVSVRGSYGGEGWVRGDLLDSLAGDPGDESTPVVVDGPAEEENAEIGGRLGELERRMSAAPAVSPPPTAPREPAESAWEEFLAAAEPYLPVAGVGVLLLVAAIVGFSIFRRRRMRDIEKTLSVTRGLDEKLRDASAGRLGEILRQSEERVRRIDEKSEERFRRLKAVLEGERSPTGTPAEGPLGRVDELRGVVLGQERQIQVMSELLELQTEKVALLERENRLLRGLLRQP